MIKILIIAIRFFSLQVNIDPCFSILHKFGYSSSQNPLCIWLKIIKKMFPLLMQGREEERKKVEDL